MAERWVELADKDGSFYDPQTGFTIPRGKRVRLTNPIGRLTATKIAGQGIVESKENAGEPASCKKPDSPDPSGKNSNSGAGLLAGQGDKPNNPEGPGGANDAVGTAGAEPSAGANSAVNGMVGPDNEPGESGAEDSPTTPEALAQARDLVIERRIETLMAENTVKQLLAAAAKMGLSLKPRANKQQIATQVAVAEWQREHGKQ